MKLKPLGDRLIVRAIEEEETTASGIVLPDTAKEKPQKGKVLAVGDGKVNEDTGKRTPLDVSEGDEVLYSKYGGPEIKVDGDSMFLTTSSTAFSIPRLRPSGFAPAATFLRPSRTIDWANTVAVVVPSPATSLVAVATSRTSCAP